MRNKWNSRLGETITEVLVSILVVALSAAMLATMVSTAVNINLKTTQATASLYEQLSQVESKLSSTDGLMLVNGEPVSVFFYTGDDSTFTAYERRGS